MPGASRHPVLAARADTPARAVVHAAGIDTEYVRLGRGEPLVLVTASLADDDTRRLIERLSTGFLVLAVAVPTLSSVGEWLQAFQEGLGIPAAHVTLHASVAMTLLQGEHDHA